MTGKRMNLMDASWLTIESAEAPMHVGTLQILTMPDDAGDDFLPTLVAHMRTTDSLARPFNQKLAPGLVNTARPTLIEDQNVDIDYHVRHSALPRPGGMRELGILVSRLHSIRLDRSRPLWECHIIEGLEDHRRFAIYTKMHHSMMDGVGGMRLMQSVYSESPDARDLPAPWSAAARKPGRRSVSPTGPMELMSALRAEITRQLKTIPGVTRTFTEMAKAAARRKPTPQTLPYTAPATMLNVPITGQRRFAIQKVSLDRVRTITKQTRTTINDVALCLCGGALRRYLLEQDALPDTPVIANLPVSVRPAEDAEEGGNAISSILANTATHIEDPLERLRVIHESTANGKARLQRMSRAEINNYTTLIMAPFMLGQMTGRPSLKRPMFNLVVSNVPGPRKTWYFNGARLDELYPVSLVFAGQALNVTVTSYVDSLDFAFTACRSALPSIQRVAVYTGEELERLEAALKA